MDLRKKNEWLQQLRTKACNDLDFREQLKRSPKDTLSEMLNISLPDNLEIRVLEDSNQVIHLVLPPANSKGLSAEDLESVTGGSGWTNCDGGNCVLA